MLIAVTSVLTGLLVLMTVLPISHCKAWWIRDGDFPRLQFAAMGLLLIVFQFLLLDRSSALSWWLMGLNSLCVVYQGWWIWPYTRLHSKEVRDAGDPGDRSNQIRVLVSNVLMPNRNAQGLLDIVRDADPDILVVVETNQWWEEQLAELEERYPYTLKCPLENLYGMHLYSRLRLSDAQIRFLVEDGRPSMHALTYLRSGKRVRLHCLHPSPPSPTENDQSSERDAELLIVGKRVANATLPVIVTGDMNDVAWSPTTRLFRKISGLLDPRIGRGMFNTYHAGHRLVRWPLDHLFHSREFTLVCLKRLPFFGSDHFPILVELAYDPVNGMRQHGLDADEDDRAWADEDIAEKSASPRDVPAPGESPRRE